MYDQDLPAALAADMDGNFEQLVLAFQDRLYAFALRLTDSPENAEEITQDALVRAYRALAKYSAGRIRTLALRRAGEYVFGRDAKRAVLAAEGVDVEGLEQLARSGMHYYGSDTTRVYCFPTCRNARRITARHRVPFSSTRQAAAAGYRPCRVCRPALAS